MAVSPSISIPSASSFPATLAKPGSDPRARDFPFPVRFSDSSGHRRFLSGERKEKLLAFLSGESEGEGGGPRQPRGDGGERQVQLRRRNPNQQAQQLASARKHHSVPRHVQEQTLAERLRSGTSRSSLSAALINAYTESTRTRWLLDRMKKDGVSPSILTYNTVINACA